MRKEVNPILDKRNDKMLVINQYLFDDPAFKMTVRTTTSNETFTLPLKSGSSYNFIIDWGDGSSSEITAYNDADITHTYASAGDHQFAIVGTCTGWFQNNAGDKLKVISIDNWGSTGFTGQGLVSAFYGCTNLSSIPNVALNSSFSGLTVLNNVFRNTAITLIPTDFIKVCTELTSVQAAFYGCASISSLPTDLFRYCTKITNFSQLFVNCTGLSGNIPEDFFYYNNEVTTYDTVFSGCRNLVFPTRLFNLTALQTKNPIMSTCFTVSSTSYSHTGTVQDIWNYVTNTHTNAFYRCTSFTNYSSIPNDWKGL